MKLPPYLVHVVGGTEKTFAAATVTMVRDHVVVTILICSVPSVAHLAFKVQVAARNTRAVAVREVARGAHMLVTRMLAGEDKVTSVVLVSRTMVCRLAMLVPGARPGGEILLAVVALGHGSDGVVKYVGRYLKLRRQG